MIDRAVLLTRAELYCESKQMRLIRQPILGHGADGSVWRTSVDSAVKALEREENFRNELTCYQRFQNAGVMHIGRFAVPYLEGYSESLRVIEMSYVDPPYLLDFAKVYLDKPLPYFGDPQLMRTAYSEWRERFGKDWQLVANVLGILKDRFGIYYVDPRPTNISTGASDNDWEGEPSDPSLGEDDST